MTIPRECTIVTKLPRIKVEERGRKAVFLNEERISHEKIRVDGCVITDSSSKSADWVISRKDVGDAIIELKGKDVEHAMKQVEATALYWIQNNYCVGKLAALIVATQYPRASTAARKAQELFTRTYKGPLHVVTKNYEGRLSAVFSFKGPFKSDTDT